MKKLTIEVYPYKTEIKNWKAFKLSELLDMARNLTDFVGKRYQEYKAYEHDQEPETDDKFREYKIKTTKIGNRKVKEWK